MIRPKVVDVVGSSVLELPFFIDDVSLPAVAAEHWHAHRKASPMANDRMPFVHPDSLAAQPQEIEYEGVIPEIVYLLFFVDSSNEKRDHPGKMQACFSGRTKAKQSITMTYSKLGVVEFFDILPDKMKAAYPGCTSAVLAKLPDGNYFDLIGYVPKDYVDHL